MIYETSNLISGNYQVLIFSEIDGNQKLKSSAKVARENLFLPV